LRVIESTAPAAPDFQLRTIHIETEPLPSPNLSFDNAVEGDVPSDIRLPAATRPTDPRPVNGSTPTPLIDRSAGENGNGRELPQPLPRLEGSELSAASMPTARSPVESAAFSSSAGGPSVEVLVGFRRPQTPATEVKPDAKEVPAAKPPVFHMVQPASAASEPEFALEAAPHLEGCVAEASAASQEPEAFEEAPQSKTSGGEPLETRIAAPAASVVSKAPPAPAEAPAAIRPEVPELPRPHIARRVSIELGGEKTEVRITVHERSGDVSVRFETGAPALRSDLQSNVGSLIEALRREHISLANLDFSGLNTAAQDTSRDHRQPRWKRPSTAPRPFVETAESTGGDRVTLSAARLGR
jgi:hypothetical protein